LLIFSVLLPNRHFVLFTARPLNIFF
jgi:hypothetical protein